MLRFLKWIDMLNRASALIREISIRLRFAAWSSEKNKTRRQNIFGSRVVAPKGIKPLSQAPETCILFIELRSQT